MTPFPCGTFSRACTLNTGPSWALTVFIRNMSLQMQMSPVHVPENTISSDQPYTAHIIVSVFPMFPLRPIRPPPEERETEADSRLTVKWVTAKKVLLVRVKKIPQGTYQPCAKTSYVSHQLWWACQEGRDLFWQQISCPCFPWKKKRKSFYITKYAWRKTL